MVVSGCNFTPQIFMWQRCATSPYTIKLTFDGAASGKPLFYGVFEFAAPRCHIGIFAALNLKSQLWCDTPNVSHSTGHSLFLGCFQWRHRLSLTTYVAQILAFPGKICCLHFGPGNNFFVLTTLPVLYLIAWGPTFQVFSNRVGESV